MIPPIVINLESRTDRLEKAKEQLNQFKVPYTIWPAIKHEKGRLGLILTMEQIFTHCLKMNYPEVFILEDDFKIVTKDFTEIWDLAISQLPKDYDLLYAGCNISGKCERYRENLFRCQGVYATHAVLYSRAAIERIVPLLAAAQTYDIMLVNGIQNSNKTFCTSPLLITQTNGFSNIQNKEVDYTRFIEKRYEQKTK